MQRKKTDWKVVNVDTETEKEHFVKHDGEVNRERRRKTNGSRCRGIVNF